MKKDELMYLQIPLYSFCEIQSRSYFAGWHIRKLSSAGRKLGGGADTPSLCGMEVNWDLEVALTDFHLSENTCTKCLERYGKINKEVDFRNYERR